MSTDTTETVAAYTDHDGVTYEIDHLGICLPSQWGEFAVYSGGVHVTSFAIAESMLKPEFRPAELPVTRVELIGLARQAVAEERGDADDRDQDESIAAFMASQDARRTADLRLS